MVSLARSSNAFAKTRGSRKTEAELLEKFSVFPGCVLTEVA
jgi:hypothetical protein